MRKSKLTFSILSTLAIPAAGAYAAVDVKPFAASLNATDDTRSVLSREYDVDRDNTPQGMLVASGEVRDVIREQVRTRVETGEFGENELGEKGETENENENENEKGDDGKDDDSSEKGETENENENENEKGDDGKDDDGGEKGESESSSRD
jgi:hypothetical protein